MIENVAKTLAKPEAWTKGALARTAKGRAIGPHEKPAKCFCLEGAIVRNTLVDERRPAFWLVQTAIRELFPNGARATSTPVFNDHPDTTHEEIILVLRRARELELAGAHVGQ